jgi:hypothetical protein
VLILPVAIELPMALLTHAAHGGFWLGLALGAGVGAAWALFDSPPRHVETWRTGAEGEKDTARRLRPLLKKGWALFNDIETEHGNIVTSSLGRRACSCSSQSAWWSGPHGGRQARHPVA